jgi:hypothetical protein
MSLWDTLTGQQSTAAAYTQAGQQALNQAFDNALAQNHGLLNNPAMTQQQQGQMAAQYNQQLWQRSNLIRSDWVYNGEPMSIAEFAEAVYGDTPARTAFLLRYAGGKNV